MGLFDTYMQNQGGLLSGFDDPRTVGLLSAGASMLANSGPSLTPKSFTQNVGGGILGGLGAYGEAKKSLLDQQREAMQMDLLKQQVAQMTRKNSLINNMLAQYSGQGGSGGVDTAMQALSDGAKVGDIGPTVTNAARMDSMPQNQSSGSINGIPREAISYDLAFNDGKNIPDWMFKRGTPNMQVHNNYAVDMNKVQPGFLPGLTVSQSGQASLTMPDGNGGVTVSAPAGAIDTYTSYRNADEAAKAKYGTTTIPFKSGPRMVSNAQLPDILGGENPPTKGAPQNWRQINTDYQNGQGQRDNERLAILLDEYRKEQDPVIKAAIGREIFSASGHSSSLPGVALQDQNQEGVKAEIAKQRLGTVEKEAQSQQDILGKLSIAETLIKNGAYGNSVWDRIGLAAHNAGLQNTQEGINSNLLSQIGNQLVLARGSLGAGVSTSDADRYEKAAGDFTKAQSNQQRLAAIGVMREVADKAFKNANTVRQEYNNTGNTPDYAPPQPSQPKTSIQNIPTAAINHLKFNPKLRDQFDAKYGAGAAASILGK